MNDKLSPSKKSFQGKLGSYTILQTEDHTQTVYSEFFDEACHNLSGAYAETLHNYILGCGIPDRFNQKTDFAVLDVGFGVGVGLLALLDEARKHHFSAVVHYYSIELDPELFLWAAQSSFPELIFTEKREGDLLFFQAESGPIHIKVFIGDGRQTLPLALSLGHLRKWDAIFQDPFSPKKNPALWSVEWFEFLKAQSSPDVRLATYSSSLSIRKSLLEAGWSVINDRGFALKRAMTKANLMDLTAPEVLDQLQRSPSQAIRDRDIS